MIIGGFTGNFGEEKKVKIATERGPETFLQFDSRDRRITFPDSILHAIALGTTGSGKTRTFILPALRAHIEAGHSGLIVDIKGNLADYARAMAAGCGREKDFLEYGPTKSSIPLNLLETMTIEGFHTFCMGLINKFCDGKSNNMDFHAHGASMARDAFQMLSEIAAWQRLNFGEATISPTLPLILELFTSPPQATDLFNLYCSQVADNENEETRKFIRQVKNSNFHILNQDRKPKGSTHREQMSYATHGLIMAIKGFLDEDGMVEKFCGNCAPGIHCRSILEEGNKIIVLRFGVTSGAAAAQVSRMILNDFYAAIYKIGLEKPERRFVCIDELQEVVDLSSGKYSDANFVALAREFGCGFMGATQSLSALVAKSSTESAEAFLSNCNQKIFLYSEDPLTREHARRFDEGIDLVNLKTDEAFAVTYNSTTREHKWSKEGLSFSYRSCLDLQPMKGEPIEKEFPKLSIERVMNYIRAAQKKKELEEARKFARTHRQKAEKDDDEWGDIFDDSDDCDDDNSDYPDLKASDESDEDNSALRRTIRDIQANRALNNVMWEQTLKDNFKNLIADAGKSFEVPREWQGFVAHVLRIYATLESPCKIECIKMVGGRHLVATPASPCANDSIRLLNRMLFLTDYFQPRGGDLKKDV